MRPKKLRWCGVWIGAALGVALAAPAAVGQMVSPSPPSLANLHARLGETRFQPGPLAGFQISSPLYQSTWTPNGWGVFATAEGRSIDLLSRSDWAVDPIAGASEIEAGFGWRQPDLALMIGYAQPDFAVTPHGWLDPGWRLLDNRAQYQINVVPQSVVGVSLTFHLQ